MFFGVFFATPSNWSEKSLTAGVYCVSSTRRGQEDSCCCCCQPVLGSENTVCWLIWCLLSSRWDHPLHPPHPLLPFTPTDWDWDWEGGWCRSFCFLTPTPWPPPPAPKHLYFYLCKDSNWQNISRYSNHTKPKCPHFVNEQRQRERDRECVCGFCLCVRFYAFVFRWNRLFCKDPSGEFDQESCYDDCD